MDSNSPRIAFYPWGMRLINGLWWAMAAATLIFVIAVIGWWPLWIAGRVDGMEASQWHCAIAHEVEDRG